jgi:hypothetical protein
MKWHWTFGACRISMPLTQVGEPAVLEMNRAIHPHRDRLSQRGARLRRPHGDHRRFGADPMLEVGREREGSQVERADHVGTVALDGLGLGVEVGVFDERDLLDEDRDLEHLRGTPCAPKANRALQARAMNPSQCVLTGARRIG